MHGIRNWRQCQKGLGTAIEWSDDEIITSNTDRDTADELVHRLMAAFASQSTIGWKYVFRGLVSEKWAEAFAYNYKGDNPVRAGQWTRLLIKSFSNIAENVWMARNGIFHGKDKKECLAMKKANLVPAIERAFAIQPTALRVVDRTLLTGTSRIAMLQTSYQNQLAWLGSVRSAMFATAFAGRQSITTNEPGYLPMGDGRVINPQYLLVGRGAFVSFDSNEVWRSIGDK
jgi:hypothetical protein